MNTVNSTQPVLFGTAYYDEYMPKDVDRIDTDMEMMRTAGMNVIRIAESTWSTYESQPGEFDFSHVDRALDAAQRHGIHVIVGTPTYAVPTWLVAMHPDVLAVTPNGPGSYGSRQIMDIVNPTYLFYAERIIRRLIAHVAQHPAVIGYQVDNETKYYDSVSPDMQALFIKYLRRKFGDDTQTINDAFGLDYWSNRIDAWEDFPDVTKSINASLKGEFDRFRREQVTRFLSWQADIVREYAGKDQFITQNFDFEWRGHSYGLQPDVDHFKTAGAVDIVGVDIYHPTEDDLTGKEIAFGGDMARSMKDGANYLVLETEAQGQNGWLPYPGQLRLQAYSHLASGADSVMYWHWHSIHNSFETYWKGVLSHDLEPNPTYEEAGVFGREIADGRIDERVAHLRKHNRVAIMVSNESLSALDAFRLETGFPNGVGPSYNDIVRRVYDALFELNVECDFLPSDAPIERLARYAMVVTPALYCTTQQTIDTLREYVRAGGHLVSTLRSFVADETVTVWHDRAPHGLTDVFGMTYDQFTRPNDVKLTFADAPHRDSTAGCNGIAAHTLIELLNATEGTETLASYDHYAWKTYAAITRHAFGKGSAQWIGTVLDAASMKTVLRDAVEYAGVNVPGMALSGVVSVRQGKNADGETVTYIFNYSAERVGFASPVAGEVVVRPRIIAPDGTADDAASKMVDVSTGLLVGATVTKEQELELGPWGLVVIVG